MECDLKFHSLLKMEQQGRVVQTVVTTETTTDYDYDEPVSAREILGIIRGTIFLSSLVMMTYILVRGVSEGKEKKIFLSPKNPTKMYNVEPCREIKVCCYCKKICTFDIWTHHKECKKEPEEK